MARVGRIALLLGISLYVLPAQAEPQPSAVNAASATKPAPPGYHVETRIRKSLLGRGIAATSASVMFLAVGLVAHGQAHNNHETDYSPVFFVLSGVSAAVAIPLIVLAVSDRRDVYVKDQVTLRLAPSFSRDYAGGRLTMSF